LPAEPTEEPRVNCNASIPTLANQLLAAMQAAAIRNKPPEPTSESDNFLQLAKDATKPLNLHRPDKELGDLDWRFSEDTGRFAMDEEVGRLNSRLVIKDLENGAEHVLHGGSSELYLANRLRDLDHSFENATDLPAVCNLHQVEHDSRLAGVKVILDCSNKDAVLIGTKVNAVKFVSMSVHRENLAEDIFRQSLDTTKMLNSQTLLLPLVG
jgi:hypothetical protein